MLTMESKSMRADTQQIYQERILRVLKHLETNLDQPIRLDELAKIAHFSPFHFHHVFRGVVGESIAQHVRRLRLERAASRLKTSLQPITQIAFDAGYESHEAFTRAFGAMFDCSPSDFRAQAREQLATSRTELPSIEVRIERLPARRVAFVRHVGPYEKVSEAWQMLMSWAGPRRLFGPDLLAIGICYDDPEITDDHCVRYDACITITAPIEPEAEIGAQEIPGGDHAIATHHGPYDQLGISYGALFGQWLPRSGRILADAPPFDIYRNSPTFAAPKDLITDIHLPLKPIRS
jgi:AraC family transcriptional regulator